MAGLATAPATAAFPSWTSWVRIPSPALDTTGARRQLSLPVLPVGELPLPVVRFRTPSPAAVNCCLRINCCRNHSIRATSTGTPVPVDGRRFGSFGAAHSWGRSSSTESPLQRGHRKPPVQDSAESRHPHRARRGSIGFARQQPAVARGTAHLSRPAHRPRSADGTGEPSHMGSIGFARQRPRVTHGTTRLLGAGLLTPPLGPTAGLPGAAWPPETSGPGIGGVRRPAPARGDPRARRPARAQREREESRPTWGQLALLGNSRR